MITRRFFGKALAAAPLAAQAVKDEALARMGAGGNLGSLSGDMLGDMLPPSSLGNVVGYAEDAGKAVPVVDKKRDHIQWLRDRVSDYSKQLAGLTLDFHEEENARLHAMQRLDPDLAAMRSFSASALVAMQTERNRQRILAIRRTWLSRDLESYKERLWKALGV